MAYLHRPSAVRLPDDDARAPRHLPRGHQRAVGGHVQAGRIPGVTQLKALEPAEEGRRDCRQHLFFGSARRGETERWRRRTRGGRTRQKISQAKNLASSGLSIWKAYRNEGLAVSIASERVHECPCPREGPPHAAMEGRVGTSLLTEPFGEKQSREQRQRQPARRAGGEAEPCRSRCTLPGCGW